MFLQVVILNADKELVISMGTLIFKQHPFVGAGMPLSFLFSSLMLLKANSWEDCNVLLLSFKAFFCPWERPGFPCSRRSSVSNPNHHKP